MTDSGDVAAVLSLRTRLAAIDLLEKDGLEQCSSTNALVDNGDGLSRRKGSDNGKDSRESVRSAEVLDFPMPSLGREAAAFKSLMEQHHTKMVEATLGLFDDLHARLKASHDVQLSSRESAISKREAQAQAMATMLRESLDDKIARGKVQKHLLTTLATHHAAKSALHERLYGGPQSLLRIMHAWHVYSRIRAFKARRVRQAQVIYRQRLPRKPFLRWRRLVQTAKHDRLVDQHRMHHDTAMHDLQLQHANDIQQLRDELKRARAEIEVFQLEQVRLEEDVRRVFLRGVSAMNLEALSLFRHNPVHVPGRAVQPGHDFVDLELEQPRAMAPQPMHRGNQ
ncbi:hypothetical protein H310_03993 [Aphanomyces invadans]|uniref:Centrosomal protein POC5 n=1 Tax=Aphanomyces invadans TaxID=157072 RepID=A0A024UG85_9STRA|nr:hypothetical protein H310_03993 [Aphanomyces invadans]ETW04882.1 hypothetical protein H310_03993 [Aphanomyces invadans]|eukprot:XP_008866320.1 hypothetical protein H310_03993 [Aphanomyces invadans]